jgi:hypothetical protein
MSPVKKTHAARKHSRTRTWIVAVSVVLIIAGLLTASYFWYNENNEPNSANGNPAFAAFTEHYLEVMKSLDSNEVKSKIAPQIDPICNQTELFTWEQSRLTFANDPNGWLEDPIQILNSGSGICVQWSIVYVSACLALGYPSRLVVATDTTSWNFIHVWAEDYYGGTWVHVDPSDKVWNNPSRYQSWDWGKYIGSEIKVYAFEDGRYEDVTATYSAHTS